MDYQTFNGQQHPSFGSPFSTLPGTPAHLAQPTHSPQQQQQYADPHGRFLQSTPSPFPYGQQQQQYTNGAPAGFPPMGGGVAANGGLMQQPGVGLSHNQLHQARAAALQHQQQQHQQQQHSPSPYSTAPFAQPIPSPAHAQFVQNRQTASPSSANNHASPYAHPQTQQSSPSLVPSHPQQALNQPSSQPPTSQAMQVQTPVKALPQSPVSPGTQAKEAERIALLLEINMLLIKEVIELQAQGKAGSIGPVAPNQDAKSEGDKQQPSKEFLEFMRRLQSNLAYLAQHAEKNHKPNAFIQPGPAIMTAPTFPDELVKLYLKLQLLCPGWKGQMQQPKASPGPQRLNSGSSQQTLNSSMQPPSHSAGLQNNMQPPTTAGPPQHMQQQQQQNAMKQEQTPSFKYETG